MGIFISNRDNIIKLSGGLELSRFLQEQSIDVCNYRKNNLNEVLDDVCLVISDRRGIDQSIPMDQVSKDSIIADHYGIFQLIICDKKNKNQIEEYYSKMGIHKVCGVYNLKTLEILFKNQLFQDILMGDEYSLKKVSNPEGKMSLRNFIGSRTMNFLKKAYDDSQQLAKNIDRLEKTVYKKPYIKT